MNSLSKWLTFAFIFSINEFKLVHKTVVLMALVIGIIYFFKKKRTKLNENEKYLVIAYCLFAISFVPSFLVDPFFEWRHLDHPSRFLLFLPLIFFLREIKGFVFLKYTYATTCLIGSMVVILGYFYFDVPRGYYFNSCISGPQHLLILSSFTLLFAMNEGRSKFAYFYWISFILSIIAISCSETRGVILCIPPLVFFVCFVSPQKFKFRNILLLAFCLFIVPLIMYLAHPSFKSRILQSIENSKHVLSEESITASNVTTIGIRYKFLKFGVKAWTKAPLWGHGRGGLLEAMVAEGYDREYGKYFTHNHNAYVSALAMRGLLGFAALLLLMFLITRVFYKKLKEDGQLHARCGLIFAFAYFLFFWTDSPLIGSMHSVRFFIFFSLLLLYASSSDDDRKVNLEIR